MSPAHESYLASALAIADESRYTKKKIQKVETPWIATRLELMTMATHALTSSHILDDEDAPAAAAPAPSLAPSQPSLMRRLFDAFTEAQMRRAQREVDRILGPGWRYRAQRAALPPER
jgi:hypothetical protein